MDERKILSKTFDFSFANVFYGLEIAFGGACGGLEWTKALNFRLIQSSCIRHGVPQNLQILSWGARHGVPKSHEDTMLAAPGHISLDDRGNSQLTS